MQNESVSILGGKHICVFCGSRSGRRADYADAAHQIGTLLAGAGAKLVFGGGKVGIMGIAADAALAAGGEVVSVIPEYLRSAEVDHPHVTERHVVNDLFERKQVMMQLSDAFLALPGGLGTLDELLEVLTWRQLGRHDKPIGILNTADYFNPTLNAMQHAITEGFLSAGQMDWIIVEPDPQQLLGDLATAIRLYDEDNVL